MPAVSIARFEPGWENVAGPMAPLRLDRQNAELEGRFLADIGHGEERV
jgi:hypothetical protein